MRGFGRRFGLLALCMCLLCMPVTAVFATPAENCSGSCTHQAAIGTTHYDTITEALTAAVDGDTITVLTDISADAALTIDKAITLDLGGKTLTGQNTAEEALLAATKDLTVTNGTLITENGAALMVIDAALTIEKTASVQGGDNAIAVIVQSLDAKASAKISGEVKTTAEEPAIGTVSDRDKDCALYIDKTAVITSEGNAVEMYNTGKLEIIGGTITAKNNAVVLDIYDDMTMEASVTGGTFLTEDGEPFVITCGTDATAPEGFVTGGTFNKDPSAYIPAYCGVIDNNDGTYTVVSSYTLTFQSGGASGTMESVSVPCGESYLLPQCGFTHEESMEFAGWEINGKTYTVGSSFTPQGNAVITALWNVHEHYGGYATCMSPAVCTGCGNYYGQYGDHDIYYSDGYAATCDSTGMSPHSFCDTCGICFVDGTEISSYSLSSPALGHQWKTEKAKAATCTEAGTKEHRVCSICGTIQINGKDAEKEDLVIPALGHTLETVEATQATCTQPGVQDHTHCTTCDQLFRQNKPVEMEALTSALASHVLGDTWMSDDTIHWKTCVDCNEVFRQSAHKDTDADAQCDDCGFVMAQETTSAAEEPSGFSFLYLIPMVAAVAVAVPLAIKTAKKRK